jgi:hypothetical protein
MSSLLKVLGVLLAIITIAVSGYGLMTGDHSFNSLMILSLGGLLLVKTIENFQEGKKVNAYLNIAVYGIFIFVLIQIFYFD